MDLARIIKRVIDQKPQEKYILAVDKSKDTTLKSLISSVSKALGSGKIRKIKLNEIKDSETFPNINELTINVKLKTSSIFFDERNKNEDIYDFERRKFNWHCEFGIAENGEKIKQEFKLYRRFKKTKILICGPPGSGKSTLAAEVAKELKLPHLKIGDIIEEAKKANTPLGEEVRNKHEEILNKLVEDAENARKKVKNQPPLDRNSFTVRLPEDIVNKIVMSKLKENVCTNLGYVLDGFPRNSHEAKILFFSEKKPFENMDIGNANNTNTTNNVNNNKVNEKITDKDKNKKKDPLLDLKIIEDYSNLTIDNENAPQLVVLISNLTEDYIKNRLKDHHLTSVDNQAIPYSDERIIRRLAINKLWNDVSCTNLNGNISVFNLFKEYEVDNLVLDGRIEEVDFLVKNVIHKLEEVI